MARVTITPVAKGGGGSITDPNSTLTSWTTQSTDIDAQNIRERSVDRRNLALNSVNDAMTGTQVFEDDSNTYALTAVFAQVVLGGNNAVIGAFTYDNTADEDLIIRVTAEVTSSTGNPAALRLYRSTTGPGGPWTAVLNSTRHAPHADWRSMSIFYHEVDTFSSVTTWYALYAADAGATGTIQNVYMYAERIMR